MSSFKNDIMELTKYVGGKENIAAVTHCVTRMRFVLRNPNKAKVEKIRELKSVKGTFTQVGQFQVVIGPKVQTFYNEFIDFTKLKGTNKEAAKENMNLLQRLVANMGEIFAPLISAIIVGGLILGFRNIIGDMKFFEDGTKTLTEYPSFGMELIAFYGL